MRTSFNKNTVAKIWAVAILRDDMQKTYKEIGHRMSLSEGTVRYLYGKFEQVKKTKFI